MKTLGLIPSYLKKIASSERRHFLRLLGDGELTTGLDFDPEMRLNTTRDCKMMYEVHTETESVMAYFQISDTAPRRALLIRDKEGVITSDIVEQHYREFRDAAETYWCNSHRVFKSVSR